MHDKGLILDLENIIIFYQADIVGENEVIYSFLHQRKYLFDPEDLEGLSPGEFAQGIKVWRGKDREILANEIGVFQRQKLMDAKVNPEAAGVLQALSRKYAIALICRNRGDGIIKVLAKAGVRNYVNYIVPGESWNPRNPEVAIDLVLQRFPNIKPGNWCYVGDSGHESAAAARGIEFFPYGVGGFISLEDVMDELM